MPFDPAFFAARFAHMDAAVTRIVDEVAPFLGDTIFELGMCLGTRDFSGIDSAVRAGVPPEVQGITPVCAFTYDHFTAHQKIALAQRMPAWKAAMDEAGGALFDHIAQTVRFVGGPLGSFALRHRMTAPDKRGWVVSVNGLVLRDRHRNPVAPLLMDAERITFISNDILTYVQHLRAPKRVYALQGTYLIATSDEHEAAQIYERCYKRLGREAPQMLYSFSW